jgi:hypothetical protein
MYSLDFAYVFDPSNPDSLIEDVAWSATIYLGPDLGLVCDVTNNGITGTDIKWLDESQVPELERLGLEIVPDSIDPVRDYIDSLIGQHK